jgi:acyl-CoA hydrolase
MHENSVEGRPVKTPGDSQVESRYILMPQHCNDYGIAFGGTIMAWIDMTAAMTAQKHCQRKVVTVSTDRISFHEPIKVGDHVVLRASANFVGKTSMEVGVQVIKENPYTGVCLRATTAYLTFVGLDDQDHPTVIPGLKLESADEIRRWENARLRVEARKELVKKLNQVKSNL